MSCGDWEFLQNSTFQSSKQCGVLKLYWSSKRGWIFICKLMAADRSYTECYGSGQSTTVTKSKILKENGWHGLEDKEHSKICVQPKVDELCRFGLDWQQSEKAMIVTRPMLKVGFCCILTVEKSFSKASSQCSWLLMNFTYLNTSQVYHKQRCLYN